VIFTNKLFGGRSRTSAGKRRMLENVECGVRGCM